MYKYSKFLLILLVLILSACAGVPVATDDTQAEMAETAEMDKVKVAYVPIMKFATMYVAAERGIFEKHGLDVEIERVKSGSEAIAFLSEGQIDVGGIAIVTSLWNGWNQGLDIRVIAPGALEPFENSPTKVIARTELVDSGEISGAADLAGRTVSIAGGPGSGAEYLLSKALQRGGLTIGDIEGVNIGNADAPAAFANGSVDAALLGSPFADQVINAGDGVAIETDLTPGLMTVAFVGSGNFVNDRPDVAQRFVTALTEAARMMQGDEYLADENLAAYLAYTNSTEEALRNGRPVVYDVNMNIPVDGLSDVEATHRSNGRTEYDTSIEMTNVVDTSFVEAALSALGEQ